MSEWQPISKAPTDGRHILLAVKGKKRSFQGYGYGNGDWYDMQDQSRDPTHWMPLPEPPK